VAKSQIKSELPTPKSADTNLEYQESNQIKAPQFKSQTKVHIISSSERTFITG